MRRIISQILYSVKRICETERSFLQIEVFICANGRGHQVSTILKEFPSTLEEIIEDSKLSRKEAEKILKTLIDENLVIEKQQPHYLAAGEHFTAFYQLVG